MNKTTRLLPLFFAVAHGAMASDGASHSINWWHLGSAYKDSPALGWLALTFVIFVWGVAHAVRKPLSFYLATRSKDIRDQIEEGRQAKIESERKLKLYDEKLHNLGAEIEKLKHSFNEQAAAEKLERDRQNKETEARILRDAEDTIRANMERAKNRLAEEAITRAMALAEQTISEHKRREVDSVLKDSFLTDLQHSASDAKRGMAASELLRGAPKHAPHALAKEVQ